MVLSGYAVAGLVILFVLGSTLLAAGLWRMPDRPLKAPPAWENYRFGYPVYALIFLSFDMEMIFMYPWAVVYADLGLMALMDMFVFIAILLSGIAYAWGRGGFDWE